MQISEYINRKEKLTNTHFTIGTDGKGHFWEDGKQYTRDQFSHRYPTPLKLFMNVKQNADGTKNWLTVD